MNGHWNEQGPFRAHPPLALWVTASLIRVGAPPQQSAAIANFLYFLLIFFFIHRIGSLRDRGLGGGHGLVDALHSGVTAVPDPGQSAR